MMQCLLYEGDFIKLVFLKGPLWLPHREAIPEFRIVWNKNSSEAITVTD